MLSDVIACALHGTKITVASRPCAASQRCVRPHKWLTHPAVRAVDTPCPHVPLRWGCWLPASALVLVSEPVVEPFARGAAAVPAVVVMMMTTHRRLATARLRLPQLPRLRRPALRPTPLQELQSLPPAPQQMLLAGRRRLRQR